MSTCKHILAVLLVAGCWSGIALSEPAVLNGLEGGSIVGTLVDINRQAVVCRVAVPDSFKVRDLDWLYGRAVVLVGVEHQRPGKSPSFLTQIWQFAPQDSTRVPITFDDRRILSSEESFLGESYAMYDYAVCSEAGTAVYRDGWEWGSTLIFDAQGQSLALDESELRRACGFWPDFIQPIAWVELNREWRLVLLCSEHGGDNVGFVSYVRQDGRFERLQDVELDGPKVASLLRAALGQR